MSLIPTVYRSTDPGAPVLSGTAGSFAALMDAVLVNGYGTGPDAKPGLGWIKAFADGHKRAYQNSLADGGTGMFWRIDDSNAQYVLNSAFHTMSGIDTGVDGFGGGNNAWGKSITSNATSRAWFVIGNGRSVYVCVANGYNSGQIFTTYFCGDYECVNKAYQFNYAITFTNQATVTSDYGRSSILWPAGGALLVGARNYSGSVVGVSMATRSHLISGLTAFGAVGLGGMPYPYPPTGGFFGARVPFNNDTYLFGMYPGLWAGVHSFVLPTWTIFDSIDGLPDSSYLSFESCATGQRAQGLLALTAPWVY